MLKMEQMKYYKLTGKKPKKKQADWEAKEQMSHLALPEVCFFGILSLPLIISK